MRSYSDFYCALKISDSVGNEYGKPKDIVGETRMAFTAHADGPFDVCFENILVTGRTLLPHPPLTLIGKLKLLTASSILRNGHESYATHRIRH